MQLEVACQQSMRPAIDGARSYRVVCSFSPPDGARPEPRWSRLAAQRTSASAPCSVGVLGPAVAGLLAPQCFNGIETRRAQRWVRAKDKPDGDRQPQSGGDRAQAWRRGVARPATENQWHEWRGAQSDEQRWHQ